MPDAEYAATPAVEAPSDPATDALVGALLDSCCEQVLETMFFSPVLDHAAVPAEAGARMAARLSFRGIPSGAFEVDADAAVARSLAASFLGADEPAVTPQQIKDVLGEFTNMTCGSVLSSLGRVEYFHLAPPEVTSPAAFSPQVQGVRRGFVLENGTLGVCLRVDFDTPNG